MNDTTEGTLLGGRVKYRQFAAGHRSGFEPVLLAAAVPARPGAHVLEAGCGAGAALLCLAHRVPGIFATGLEILPAIAALANENFRMNGFSRLSCTVADAAAPRLGQNYDHIMANPPWHDAAGTRSPNPARARAHHAAPGVLTAWIAGLAPWLKPRGTITLILAVNGFSEAAAALRVHKFGGIAVFPLWPRAGQPARQVIIAARRAGRAPDRILPGLILHDAAGISPPAEAILRDGQALGGI